MYKVIGSTLLELLLVLALSSVLASGAVLAYHHFQNHTHATIHLQRWLDALSFARSYALATNQTIGICPGQTHCEDHASYARGWLVFVTQSGNLDFQRVLSSSGAWGKNLKLTSSSTEPVYFDHNGKTNANRHFVFCSKHNTGIIFLIRSGRVRLGASDEVWPCE